MAKKFLVAVDLAKNELQNGAIHNLAAAPSAPVKGQLYFNTTDNLMYFWDGTAWVSGGGMTQAAADARYVNVAGDTMTAALYIQPSTPAVDALRIVQGQVTAGSGATFDLTGAGAVKVPTPVGTTDATTKAYVDGLAGAAVLDPKYVNTNGDTMTGLLILSGDPGTALGAATKQYVDNLLSGLAWSDNVRAATTANITLSAPQTIDGVAVIAGDRVLVKNQSTASANGVYVVAAGAWTRAGDADSEGELVNMAVFVSEGTTQADTAWVCTTNAPITVGSTNITWAQFAGTGGSVPPNRTINTTAPLTGGGDLSADRTLAITSFAGSAAGAVPASGGGTSTFLRADGQWATPGGGGTVNKYATDVGGATSQVITHGLNSQDVVVRVYRKTTPWDVVECDVEHTSTTTVTLRFAVAPAAAEYRVVVVA